MNRRAKKMTATISYLVAALVAGVLWAACEGPCGCPIGTVCIPLEGGQYRCDLISYLESEEAR